MKKLFVVAALLAGALTAREARADGYQGGRCQGGRCTHLGLFGAAFAQQPVPAFQAAPWACAQSSSIHTPSRDASSCMAATSTGWPYRCTGTIPTVRGVAYVALRALPIVMPERLSIVGLDDLSIDPRMLFFAAILTIVTGLLFGMIPALQATRVPVIEGLREGARGTIGSRRIRRTRSALVVVEVALALVLTGTGVSIMVLIGLIILAGIVVNNAIVLVDYANQLRQEGRSKIDALIEAGQVRLRPILMTTLTTVLGLLPMVIAFGEGSELRVPLAITLIGGLSVATLLTLVVIPVVYSLMTRERRALDVPAATMQPSRP